MDEARLIGEVKAHMGTNSDREAERALAATLGGLAEVVRRVDLQPLIAALPERHAERLRGGGKSRGRVDLHTFYQRVAEREGVAPALGREHARAVCRALWGLIDEQARAQLAITLWPDLLRPPQRHGISAHA